MPITSNNPVPNDISLFVSDSFTEPPCRNAFRRPPPPTTLSREYEREREREKHHARELIKESSRTGRVVNLAETELHNLSVS